MWNLKALLKSYLSLFDSREFDLAELHDIFEAIYSANYSQIPPEFSVHDLLSFAKERGFVVRLQTGKFKIELS